MTEQELRAHCLELTLRNIPLGCADQADITRTAQAYYEFITGTKTATKKPKTARR